MAGASGVALVLKALKLHSCNPTLQGLERVRERESECVCV
jgi:hypothetical protein